LVDDVVVGLAHGLVSADVVAAALSVAGGTYVVARTARVRNAIALAWACGALFLGDVGIWFLALIDGLSACPRNSISN
jgi:hypothetical protein